MLISFHKNGNQHMLAIAVGAVMGVLFGWVRTTPFARWLPWVRTDDFVRGVINGPDFDFEYHDGSSNPTLLLFHNGELNDGVLAVVPQGVCDGEPGEQLRFSSWAGKQLNIACRGRKKTYCTLYDSSAGRIDSCRQVTNGQSLWVVPPGRWFVFPAGDKGRRVEIERMRPYPRGSANPIYLETIASNPRLFEIHNFMNDQEVDAIIKHAIEDRDPVTRLQRSLKTPSRTKAKFDGIHH